MKSNQLIYDGLIHPDFSNAELLNKTIDYLKKNYNVQGALAVPLPGQVEDIVKYIEMCKSYSFFRPVGLFNPLDLDIEKQIVLYKKYDCVAIKVHPRFSEWNWLSKEGLKVFNELMYQCSNYNLPIMFCTYFSSNKKLSLTSDPIYEITNLLLKYNQLRLILLHGGGVRILEYLEHFRHWDQILIDISYTLTKYDGSSVDLDLAYAFKNYDKKLSFGSDIPYCKYDVVTKKVAKLADEAKLDKKDNKMNNIMFKNITDFLNIKI